ncbi:MAG: ABC-type transport auxiliary lipoprotein family protein [Aeromonadaceae bacterium]
MRPLLCCALLCSLLGCASPSTPAYYALELPGAEPPTRQVTQGPLLVVERVVLPEYLNDMGIAFQQDDVQVVTANQARWAEALDRQLSRSLVQTLSRQFAQLQVVEGPNPDRQVWHLNLEVTGFQGRFDGKAVVAGRWLLQRGELSYSQAFQRTVPLSEDGYPALVRALRSGWQQEVATLAKEIAASLATAQK